MESEEGAWPQDAPPLVPHPRAAAALPGRGAGPPDGDVGDGAMDAPPPRGEEEEEPAAGRIAARTRERVAVDVARGGSGRHAGRQATVAPGSRPAMLSAGPA